MKKNSNTGISFGIIIGLVYCILLFIRWNNATNFILFAALAALNYILIIGILFYEAYYRRKQEEKGYIEFKDLLQTLFISVLIFEFIYAAFNYIYLTFIDPEVINRMISSMERMLDQAGSGVSDEQRNDAMSRFDELKNATSFGKVIQSYFISVAVSGVIAMIIAAIMKKKKPVFQELN